MTLLAMGLSAVCGLVVAQRSALLGDTAVDPPQVNLTGTIPAQLSAEWAANHDVVFREGVDVRGDRANTPFAGNNKDSAVATEGPAEKVAHVRHDGIVGLEPLLVRRVVVDAGERPKGLCFSCGVSALGCATDGREYCHRLTCCDWKAERWKTIEMRRSA